MQAGDAGPDAPAPALEYAPCCATAAAEARARHLLPALLHRETHATPVLTPRPVVDLSCEPGPGSGVVTYCSQFAARTAPPFAVRFASQRHPHWLACVDEEGFVTLVDTRHRLPDAMSDSTQWAGRTQWLAHHNAVFDCCWADGDASLVTCSGDQRCRLWDVSTQACVATLRGHTGSVKTCAARPDAPWGLATGGRDGSLCLWDTRSPCRGGTPGGGHGLLPVARVLFRDPRPDKRKRAAAPPLAQLPAGVAVPSCEAVSVTSAVWLAGTGGILAAGSAGDSAIKLFDCRMLTRPADMRLPCERSHACTQRRRAVTALATDEHGIRLGAAYSDSTLCVFSGTRPDAGSLAAFRGHDASTFYTKVAMSPDGSHIASASADHQVYVWSCHPDATSHAAATGAVLPCAVLAGHGGDVTGVDWCHSDSQWGQLASCADDGTIRVWNLQRREWPQHAAGHRLRAAPVAEPHSTDAPVRPPAAPASPPPCHVPLSEVAHNAGGKAPVATGKAPPAVAVAVAAAAPEPGAENGGGEVAPGGMATPHPQQAQQPHGARGTAGTASGGQRTLLVRSLTEFYSNGGQQAHGQSGPPSGPPARVHIKLTRAARRGVVRRINP